MNYKKVFFDLDGTLYPNQIGLWNEIANKIYDFMHEQLDLNREDIPTIRQGYYDSLC